MKLKELYKILDDKYDLFRLLTGELHINDLLGSDDVIDSMSNEDYELSEVEEYILNNVR